MNLGGLVGLITHEIGEELRRLARAVPRGRSIVEVGSYKGMSTCYLAAGATEGEGALVHAVDPWELQVKSVNRLRYAEAQTYRDFLAQLRKAGASDHVVVHRGFSADVARGWSGPKVGLLYIDGDHAREQVLADFHAWRGQLAPEAVLAFDDYGSEPGVTRAVDELVKTGALHSLEVRAERLAVSHAQESFASALQRAGEAQHRADELFDSLPPGFVTGP